MYRTKEREARIFLNMVPEIGPVRFRRLLRAFGSARAVLDVRFSELSRVEGISSKLARRLADHLREKGLLEKELERMEREKVCVLTEADVEYPPLLREIAAAPPILYIKGRLPPRDRATVALVGTRRPTSEGLAIADRLARGLAERGSVTVSGLAKGVDGQVHRSTLEAGGFTIAVLGNGFSYHYPEEHQGLESKIVEQGALVTEFPFASGPCAEHFPRRNRVISGLSQGVVVVEAPARSGAMITARVALEQGRDVFAVPGGLETPSMDGNRILIQEGAIPVACAEQILAQLSPTRSTLPSEVDRALLERLSEEPVSVDVLIDQTGFSAATVASRLLELELQGFVQSYPGKRVSRIV